MKIKKFNTIPNGSIVIAILFVIFNLTFIIGIILIPKPESIGAFLFSLIFIIATIDYIRTGHLNYIFISSDSIWNNDKKLSWQNVFLTMKYSKPKFVRNSFDYYIFFSDHYLTEEEMKYKGKEKNRFCLVLTKKRLLYLLSFYKKEVKILGESPYAKKLLENVKNHNQLIYNYINKDIT